MVSHDVGRRVALGRKGGMQWRGLGVDRRGRSAGDGILGLVSAVCVCVCAGRVKLLSRLLGKGLLSGRRLDGRRDFTRMRTWGGLAGWVSVLWTIILNSRERNLECSQTRSGVVEGGGTEENKEWHAQVPERPGRRRPSSLDAVLITPVSACTAATRVVVVCRG